MGLSLHYLYSKEYTIVITIVIKSHIYQITNSPALAPRDDPGNHFSKWRHARSSLKQLTSIMPLITYNNTIPDLPSP